MSKSLYMMHIPKCGGFAFKELCDVLKNKGLKTFPPRFGFSNFEDYAYIYGHLGNLPMQSENIEVACLVRDPVDRVLSNFIWFNMQNVFENIQEYKNMASLEERFKFFVFNDLTFQKIHNLQTRFLCNSINENAFNLMNGIMFDESGEPINLNRSMTQVDYYTDWFIDGDVLSVEVAKANIDKMSIVECIDNYDIFVDKVTDWFYVNHDVGVKDEFINKTSINFEKYNYGEYVEDGLTYTTEFLKSLLTSEEIEQIYALNSLDLEIYNYVKEKNLLYF
jgi:hypothetical protein